MVVVVLVVVVVRNREQQLAPEIGFRVARLIRVLNLFRETGETERRASERVGRGEKKRSRVIFSRANFILVEN